ncbi:hypothetical protein DIPPA_14280 [Diplonema papillatum]|nr:hypothetical protein DIPPA_14280 [Diplonema papillatum]
MSWGSLCRPRSQALLAAPDAQLKRSESGGDDGSMLDEDEFGDAEVFEEIFKVGFVRFKVLRTRGGCEVAQLGGICLWASGAELKIQGVANPAGSPVEGHSCTDAVKPNETWWIDKATQPLILQLETAAVVTDYALRTAGSDPHNDPSDWVIEGATTADGPWRAMHHATSVELPSERLHWSHVLPCHAPRLLNGDNEGVDVERRGGAVEFTRLPPPASHGLFASFFQATDRVIRQGFLTDAGGKARWCELAGVLLCVQGKEAVDLTGVVDVVLQGSTFHLWGGPRASGRKPLVVLTASTDSDAQAWVRAIRMVTPSAVGRGIRAVLTTLQHEANRRISEAARVPGFPRWVLSDDPSVVPTSSQLPAT